MVKRDDFISISAKILLCIQVENFAPLRCFRYFGIISPKSVHQDKLHNISAQKQLIKCWQN